LITADIGALCLDKFKKDLSSQYINMGVAEQNMIGVAAGLSMAGKIVYVYGIIPFVTMRCYEQIRIDICSRNLPVTIVGIGAGLDYSTLGFTHHGTKDLALMRSLSGMAIFNPSDDLAAEKIAELSYREKGSKYIRLDRIGQPLIYKVNYKSSFSEGFSILKEGRDLLIIATGRILETAMKVMVSLNNKGLLRVLSRVEYIVTLEEHSLSGGVGEAIGNLLCTKRMFPRFMPIGLSAEFCKRYGTREYLYRVNRLDAGSVTDYLKNWIKQTDGISHLNCK
jgi:transketolase